MDTTFPFGLPTATAFYATLFVLTLVLHVLFMNYVLAGSAWLAWSLVTGRLRPGEKLGHEASHTPATSATILLDWIPAMLSGAITAGVAPLLFLQILYQREFYTANLLLFSRWMSILPVLIIGFYSLYVLRSRWLARRRPWMRVVTSLLPFLCVAFVAYSWTENHLLSVSSPEKWREFYAQGRQVYFEPQIIPRLAVWGLGSIPTMCVWLGWQMRYRLHHAIDVDAQSLSQLPKLALFGLLASIIGGIAYYASAPQRAAEFLSPMARLYLAIAIAGVAAQLLGWYQMLVAAREQQYLSLGSLMMCSSGLLATLLGMSVCREVIRLSALGPERLVELIPQHAASMKVEGFWVFMLFAVINVGLIGWCFWLVKSAVHSSKPEED